MTVTYLPGAILPERDRQARFATEVEPLLDVLARGARRLTRSDADAEDLLQDTLMRAYIGFHTFSEGTNLKAWLYRILTNQFINTYRKKQRQPQTVDGPDDIDEWYLYDKLGGRNVETSAENEVLDQMPDEDVKKALESLPENFRMPVLLADVEGFSYKEIAEIMDTPIGTVMSRLHRGRRQLRTMLADYARERGMRVDADGNPVRAVEGAAS